MSEWKSRNCWTTMSRHAGDRGGGFLWKKHPATTSCRRSGCVDRERLARTGRAVVSPKSRASEQHRRAGIAAHSEHARRSRRRKRAAMCRCPRSLLRELLRPGRATSASPNECAAVRNRRPAPDDAAADCPSRGDDDGRKRAARGWATSATNQGGVAGSADRQNASARNASIGSERRVSCDR